MRATDHLVEIKRRLHFQQQLIDFFCMEEYQRDVVNSSADILIVGGGNRSGKTELGAARMTKVIMRTHPHIHRPWYQKMRIITEDLDIADNTVIPKLRKLLPQSALKGGSFDKAYNKKSSRIILPNYGEIQIKTNKQDVEAHRGADLDFEWFDEETKKKIHTENTARLGDRKGLWQMTFTPEKGASFIHDDFMSRCSPGSNMEYYFLDIFKNIHIDRIAQIKGLAQESDRTIRIKLFGEIINLVGLVYPEFSRKIHIVAPFSVPKQYNLFIGVDFGINNPAAAVFWVLSPEGSFFQVDEIYGTGWTVEQLAEKVVKLKKERYPDLHFRFGVYDGRSGAQRTYQTNVTNGEVFKKACGFGPWYPSEMTAAAIPSRINAMHNLLVPVDDWARFRITSNCRNTIREFGQYSYGKEKEERNNPEKPLDANDHTMNACEYIAEANPKFFDPAAMYVRPKVSRYSRGGII
jgi:phage terminase large subunit-like protein